MKESKKYSYHVMQNDAGWSVEIVRRVSSKKTVVSKRQDGFASEEEAHAWGKAESQTLLTNMNIKAQKKRRARNGEQDGDII